MIGLVEPHYGILSDQVEDKESLKMLVTYQKTQRLDYFEFVSENFSLVRSGSELNYPETDFDNFKILFIVSLHFGTANPRCSMHITTYLELHGYTKRVCKVHKKQRADQLRRVLLLLELL